MAPDCGARMQMMPKPSRRHVLGGLALLTFARPSLADAIETSSVEAREGPLSWTHYAASGSAKRPAVIILHGSRGLELRPRAYQRYAEALAAEGIDACLVRYFGPADAEALSKLPTPASRGAYDEGRFGVWSDRVSAAVTAILSRPDSSGRLGLLGFSLGGFVAATTAARDDRVSALAVLYGGMPRKVAPGVTRLPALIELHGDADHNVAPADGEALVALAKSVGAPAEHVVYPGKGHGFDFADNDPMTADAIQRVTHFFTERLMAG
jgi:carboxymethylenebutenolidase